MLNFEEARLFGLNLSGLEFSTKDHPRSVLMKRSDLRNSVLAQSTLFRADLSGMFSLYMYFSILLLLLYIYF